MADSCRVFGPPPRPVLPPAMPASDPDDTAGTDSPVDSSEQPANNGSPGGDASVVCANCSHRFDGTYCPDCGQKRDASVTVLDLVSGFFREVMDLEGGFWPTVKGLTLRPGRTLQRYLSGARRSYMHPGRYLLASIVIATLVVQAMTATGVTTDTEIGSVVTEAPVADTASTEATEPDTTSAAYQLGYQFGRLMRPEVEPGETRRADPDAAADGQEKSRPNAAATPSGGPSTDPPTDPSTSEETTTEETPDSAESYFAEFLTLLGDHYFRMGMSVAMAFFLGLVYLHLFPGSISGIAPAVAVGLFVTAHSTILETVLLSPFKVAIHLYQGESVDPSNGSLGMILFLLWCAAASALAFGRTWRDGRTWWTGLKGLAGGVVAFLDAVGLLLLAVALYSGTRFLWSGGTIEHPVLSAVLIGAGGAVILLLFAPHLSLVLIRRAQRG